MCGEVPNPAMPDGAKITFYDALNEFRAIENLDVYVTGSNSKMLSKDIKTEFRGRGDEVRVHPLSFCEYFNAVGVGKAEAFETYMRYGGMPFSVTIADDAGKEEYLRGLFDEVYLKDIIERKHIEREDIMSQTVDFLCSSTGSLTNANNIAKSIAKVHGLEVATNTVASYIRHLEDAYLFTEAKRYDVKGHTYFDYPQKYYCEDVGLRNARTGYRHQEPTHIMENIIFNELVRRGYSIDVGVVIANESNSLGKKIRVQREIDFVVNRSDERLYIQSAYALSDEEKRRQELRPFSLTGDSFRKIVIRQDMRGKWYSDEGILNLGVYDFLLEPSILDNVS
jgi:predicted AAA+ superfamily ATPase